MFFTATRPSAISDFCFLHIYVLSIRWMVSLDTHYLNRGCHTDSGEQQWKRGISTYACCLKIPLPIPRLPNSLHTMPTPMRARCRKRFEGFGWRDRRGCPRLKMRLQIQTIHLVRVNRLSINPQPQLLCISQVGWMEKSGWIFKRYI